MTAGLKSTTTDNGYYIYAEIDKYGVITVAACPMIDEYFAGYPVARCTYHHSRKDVAMRTYRKYVKKYGGQ